MSSTKQHERRALLVLTPSADLYGSDRSLLHALPALVESFDVTLVAAVEGPMLDRARGLGARVFVSPDWALRRRGLSLVAAPATVVRVVRSLLLLWRLHRRARFRGVYANTVANGLLPLLRFVVRAPLVVHVREVPRDRARLARVLFRAVERSSARVVCNSTFTARLVTDLVPQLADRTVVVPNGVEELDVVAPGDGHPLRLVCVGRIHPKKGQGVLIDAVRRARELGHQWEVHFWGEALPEHGALAAELRTRVVAAGLEDAVVWHGYSPDTRALYAGMDVAVVPSVLPEEFSLVAAEAQMVGLPVVATGPGGPSDIVVDGVTGSIVAADDPDALARAIMALEDTTRRREWGAAGRRRASELFSVERYAPAVTHEIVVALGSPPRP